MTADRGEPAGRPPPPPPQPQPQPQPQRLPTVGHRLDLTDEVGRPVTVIRRKDGVVEIHPDGTGPSVILDAPQARALGALAWGHVVLPPRLIERTADVLGGIEFDWVTVPAGSWVDGSTIEELAVRRRTGATIVAVLRGSLAVVDPDPGQRIAAGDELIIVGQADGRAVLERFLAEGP